MSIIFFIHTANQIPAKALHSTPSKMSLVQMFVHLFLFHSCLRSFIYYVESNHFFHAFITYNNFMSPKYSDVIDIELDSPSMLRSDIDTFLHFFDDKSLTFFHSIVTNAAYREHYDRIMLLLKSILYDVGRSVPKKEYTDPLISKTLQYIHDHFSEEISVLGLAKSVNLSTNQFSRRFSNQTGLSPHQYLKQYRFDIALSMLNAGISISEIAEHCGYHSVSAFSNSFKKNFGVPPTKIF